MTTVDQAWKTNSWKTKSGRFFCVRQVYYPKPCQQIWWRVKQPFILFFTCEVNSTMRRCFYHTDIGQNAVFHNFARQIVRHSIFRTIEARASFAQQIMELATF